jgi:hypothetical protein
MTLIRKLALALFLALLSASYSNSQNLDPVTGLTVNTTGNVLNLGGGLPWTNTVTGQAGGVSGGDVPAYNPGTGNIIFGYTQATVSQSIAINNALAAAGTGIQLSGYKYAWQINNDLLNGGGNRGTLTANVSLTGATGNVLESFNYDYNQNYPGFTLFSGTQFFNNRYTTAQASNLTVSFTGKDQNFWAGYYGPRVHVDNLSLLYSVDPCKTNPAYSSTCVGFNNVVNTNNLLDSTKGGSYLNQAFAINTALQNAGVGATVHGFNYGFNWRVGQGFFGCTAWNQDGSCSWTMNIPAYANATVSLTNNSNQSLYSKNYSFTSEGTSGSVSDKYLLSSSINQSLLGMGRITGSASGTGSSIEGAWAKIIYTADPCVVNPLHSPDCKGYALAIAKQLAPPTSSTTTTDGTQATNTEPVTGMSVSDPTQPPPPGSTPPPPGSEPPPGSQPPPPGSPPPPGATQTASSNPSSTPANQPPPQGGSQPKAGEIKTAGDSNSKAGPSLSSVMSMISSNQARIGNEAKSVVQAAESAATQSATSAQQQAETVAGEAVMQSQTDNTTSSGNNASSKPTNSQTQNSSIALIAATQTTVGKIEVLKSGTTTQEVTSASQSSMGQVELLKGPATSATTIDAVSISSVTTVTSSYVPQSLDNTITTQPNYSTSDTSRYELFSLRGPANTVEAEIPQLEGIKMGGRSPLNDAMEQRTMLPNTTAQEQKTDAVNKNVQPNELAGKVDIASMATQPIGYQVYSMMMPDASFYAPKEIYRNQVNVDNTRALRQLSSDKLHQDLVNLQYK